MIGSIPTVTQGKKPLKTRVRSFPGGSLVKNSAMQEMMVRSLGQEDPLVKEMATPVLPGKSEAPGGLQSMRLQSQTQLSN